MKYNNSWYSVIVSILMVGFLLIISTGVFHLVLVELNDNRGRENYLKASAGAEWALELALLQIKEKWYGYYDTIESTVNDRSVMLSKNPLDKDKFKPTDVRISYDMDSKVNAYSGTLPPLWFDILPLFYLDDDATNPEKWVTDITFQVMSGSGGLTSWNIVSSNGGVSSVGNFSGSTPTQEKVLEPWWFKIISSDIGSFLSSPARSGNYLILFNADDTDPVTYTLDAPKADEYFTKPRAEIISSSQVWKYKQNFRTIVDNTEYLNVLKYSVFWN